MRKRMLGSILIGLIYGMISSIYALRHDRGAGDLAWAACAARAVLQGAAPYQTCGGVDAARYPLTTALTIMPLAWLPPVVLAGVVVGLSAAMLSWGLLGTGQPWRLLVLCSFPAISCAQVANWSLLLLAGLYVPGLAILAVAKPHVGLPVFAVRAWRQPRLYALPAGLLVAISLAIRPSWPGEMAASLSTYSGRPALLMYGPLLIPAMIGAARRRPGAAWLLACAVVPLRGFYDWVMLSPALSSQRQMIIWIIAGWLGYGLYYVSGQEWLAGLLVWLPAIAAVTRSQVSTD